MKLVLSFLIFITIVFQSIPASNAFAAAEPSARDTNSEIIMSVQVSPSSSFHSEIRIRSAKWTKGLIKLKQTESLTAQKGSSDIQLSLSEGGLMKEYTLWVDGSLTDSKGNAWKARGKWPKLLQQYAEKLRSTHYGRLVTWSEADALIPKGTEFTVRDLETGLRFRVKRRAGSDHADVQPLTKQDTAVMKEIYNGQWSWHRRAILAESKEGWLAASMHGMPHGGDGIPGNDFNGHFCIHFAGSVTHKSDSLDPAHQVMVHKAAGRLESYIDSLSPIGLIELFMVAANQKDRQIMKLLRPKTTDDAFLSFWLNPDLKMIRPVEIKERPQPDDLSAVVEVKASQLRSGSPRSELVTIVFRFARMTPQSPWKIEEISMQAI